MSTFDITLRTTTSAFRNNFDYLQKLRSISESGQRSFGNDLDGLLRNRTTSSIERRSAQLDRALSETQDTAAAMNLAVTKGAEALDLLYEAEDLFLQGQAETDIAAQATLYKRSNNLIAQANSKLEAASYNGQNFLLNSTTSLFEVGSSLGRLDITGSGISQTDVDGPFSPKLQVTENDWITTGASGTTTIATATTDATNATFSLVNDYGGLFSIDATTGVITANVYDPANAGSQVLEYDFSDPSGHTIGASFTANDLAGTANNATQATANEQPTASGADTLNGLQAARFDGTSADDGKATDILHIANENAINTQDHTAKTLSFTFSADDVTTRQILFEEGGGTNGLSAHIEGGSLYVGAYNSGGNTRFSYVEHAGLVVGETYSVTFQYDGTQATTGGTWTQMTVNGVTSGATNENNFNSFSSHSGGVGLGANRDGVRIVNTGSGTMNRNISGSDNTGFDGVIGEFNYYSDTMTAAEADGLNNYHRLKWQGFSLDVSVTDNDSGLTSTSNATIQTSGGTFETVTIDGELDVDPSSAINELKTQLNILRAKEVQAVERENRLESTIATDQATDARLSAIDTDRTDVELSLAELRNTLSLNSLSLLGDTSSGGQKILQAFLNSNSSNGVSMFNIDQNGLFSNIN